MQELTDVVSENLDPELQASRLLQLLQPYLCPPAATDLDNNSRSTVSGSVDAGSRSGSGTATASVKEVLLPVDMSYIQADAYCSVLARHYELLTDPKPPR